MRQAHCILNEIGMVHYIRHAFKVTQNMDMRLDIESYEEGKNGSIEQKIHGWKPIAIT